MLFAIIACEPSSRIGGAARREHLGDGAPVQRQQHEARLAAFGAALRSDLANQYRVIRFACESRPCNEDAAAVLTQARISSARYLLVGAVHKMSTLVGWAKAQIIDLRDDKVAFERLLSFRGDDDEAWRRAEQFLVDGKFRFLIAIPAGSIVQNAAAQSAITKTQNTLYLEAGA